MMDSSRFPLLVHGRRRSGRPPARRTARSTASVRVLGRHQVELRRASRRRDGMARPSLTRRRQVCVSPSLPTPTGARGMSVDRCDRLSLDVFLFPSTAVPASVSPLRWESGHGSSVAWSCPVLRRPPIPRFALFAVLLHRWPRPAGRPGQRCGFDVEETACDNTRDCL
jgi:hypothetical protein